LQRYILRIFVLATSAGIGPGDTGDDDPTLCHKEVYANLPFRQTRFESIVLAPSIVAGSLFWLMEWADSTASLGDDRNSMLRMGRTWLARLTFGWGFFVGSTLWRLFPVCLDIDVIGQGEKRQVQVMGYANAFGSPFFIFWTLFLSLISIFTQLTGQLVLALGTVALIAFLEVLDSVRDVKGIEAAFVEAGAPSTVIDPVASSSLSPRAIHGCDTSRPSWCSYVLWNRSTIHNKFDTMEIGILFDANRYLLSLTHHRRPQLTWSYFPDGFGSTVACALESCAIGCISDQTGKHAFIIGCDDVLHQSSAWHVCQRCDIEKTFDLGYEM
jgi:hypothetical protein